VSRAIEAAIVDLPAVPCPSMATTRIPGRAARQEAIALVTCRAAVSQGAHLASVMPGRSLGATTWLSMTAPWKSGRPTPNYRLNWDLHNLLHLSNL
jgi:hypothetical protein